MEIEKSIEVLNEFLDIYKNYEDYEEVIDNEIPQAIETVLKDRENSISKDKIIEKIEKLDEEINKRVIGKITKHTISEIRIIKSVYMELLEEE